MKKIIIISSILLVVLIVSKAQKSNIIIPSEAIRFRVIANSDSPTDQAIKYKVKEELDKDLKNIMQESSSIDESRKNIKNNLKDFDQTVNNTLLSLNKQANYKINYGKNYFPKKIYKGLTYEEGEYESLVVTLGEGMGENWWCVLFPPLCLLEAEDNNTDDVEYQLFAKKIIDKFQNS